MQYGTDIFLESDILTQLAKYTGKVAVHFKAINLIQDSSKEDEVWDFYYGKIPQNLLNILMQHKEAYCILETNEAALNAYDEWFPNKNQLLEDEQHFFIRAEFVSADGTMHIVND